MYSFVQSRDEQRHHHYRNKLYRKLRYDILYRKKKKNRKRDKEKERNINRERDTEGERHTERDRLGQREKEREINR